jgi:hypothetical protein
MYVWGAFLVGAISSSIYFLISRATLWGNPGQVLRFAQPSDMSGLAGSLAVV